MFISGPDLVGREQPLHGRRVCVDRRHTLHLHPVVYAYQPDGKTPTGSVADPDPDPLHRIHMFLGLPDPLVRVLDPDPALDPNPDPSIIVQK
jgi:hypothetical protein